MSTVGTSLTVNCYTALYTSQVNNADIVVSSTTLQGRTETVLDFNGGDGVYARDFEAVFSWPISQGTILYTFQPSIIGKPENTYDRATDWMPLAPGGGAGFCQGILVEADTFNVPKVFQLQDSDTLAFHTLNEVGAGVAFNKQSIKVFSCTTPFIAHSVRVTTDDGIPWRVWRTDIIAQPFPEETMLWQTELTSLDGLGWQFLRYMNIAYLSTAAITLSFTVDSDNGSIAPTTITVPSSSGTQTKLFLQVSANKWKLIGFSAVSTAPFRLWLPDLEVIVRSWGIDSVFRKMKPFGGNASPAAEV